MICHLDPAIKAELTTSPPTSDCSFFPAFVIFCSVQYIHWDMNIYSTEMCLSKQMLKIYFYEFVRNFSKDTCIYPYPYTSVSESIYESTIYLSIYLLMYLLIIVLAISPSISYNYHRDDHFE